MQNQEFMNIFFIIQSLFKKIEEYICEYITKQYSKELSEDLYVKVSLPVRSHLVNIEIFSKTKNVIITYDLILSDFLSKCSNSTIYPILDDSIDKMIIKIKKEKKHKKLHKEYLNYLCN